MKHISIKRAKTLYHTGWTLSPHGWLQCGNGVLKQGAPDLSIGQGCEVLAALFYAST